MNETPLHLTTSGFGNGITGEVMGLTVERTFPGDESVNIPDSHPVREEPRNLEFRCSRGSCQERFSKIEDLYSDQKLVSHYPCGTCGRLSSNNFRLYAHKKTHDPKVPCEICGVLLTKQSLQKHNKVLHSENAEMYRQRWKEAKKRCEEKKKRLRDQ